ncbi:Hypothetical protein CINCED_3A014173 [Cinara cedri]|uniref:Eukaryotic porin/Tom40 n=1 Tax=Cinara cedri TaxID=506608 RepID=A0A5E4NDW2_9HEMI|nr:Hypothetical protein CINCED_3A014173 [Cinara cedri]
MTECLEVNPFTGVRVNVLARTETPTKSGWQANSFSKFKWQTNRPWVTVGWDGRLPEVCSVSTAADVNVVNGNYILETVGQAEGGCLDASFFSQFSKWKQLSAARIKVNYRQAGKSIYAGLGHKMVISCMDPKPEVALRQRVNAGVVQYMQTITCDLSAGVKLGLKHRYPILDVADPLAQLESGDSASSQTLVTKSMFRPALLAHYVTDKHQVSGQFKPLTKAVKLAYYYHHNDVLQTGITFKRQGPFRAMPVVRLSLRSLTDKSVLLTTVGTDGISGMLEKRLNDWIHVYGSFYFDRNDYGLGFGISMKVVE